MTAPSTWLDSGARRLVREAVAAGARGAGIDPKNVRANSPAACRARWGAWLALAAVMTAPAIARGMGMHHTTIYVALPKARTLLAAGDDRLTKSHGATLIYLERELVGHADA